MSHFYEDGYVVGETRKDDPTYDVRYDMADAARRGKTPFAEFKRGMNDALDGKPRSP
jgi:hypothetical protein